MLTYIVIKMLIESINNKEWDLCIVNSFLIILALAVDIPMLFVEIFLVLPIVGIIYLINNEKEK